MTIGIVALAFAKRATEPNPVNRRLAAVVNGVDDDFQQIGESAIVVAQEEISLAIMPGANLVTVGQEAAHTNSAGDSYLDTSDVLNVAFETFRKNGIEDVIVIANPFIHLQATKRMVKKAGFRIVNHRMPWVGFDNSPDNLQWWCRGPLRFITYLGIQALGKILGKNWHGIGERSK